MGKALFFTSQTDQFQNIGNLSFDSVARLTNDLHRQSNVLVHGLRRQQTEVLEHGPDLASQLRN